MLQKKKKLGEGIEGDGGRSYMLGRAIRAGFCEEVTFLAQL